MIYTSSSLANTFLAGDHQRRGGSERHPGGRGGAVGATSSAVGGGATSPAGALVPPGGREVGAWERGPIDDVGWQNVIECNRIYRSSKGLRMQVPQYRNMHLLQRRCHWRQIPQFQSNWHTLYCCLSPQRSHYIPVMIAEHPHVQTNLWIPLYNQCSLNEIFRQSYGFQVYIHRNCMFDCKKHVEISWLVPLHIHSTHLLLKSQLMDILNFTSQC